jgi:hypothetical protein
VRQRLPVLARAVDQSSERAMTDATIGGDRVVALEQPLAVPDRRVRPRDRDSGRCSPPAGPPI